MNTVAREMGHRPSHPLVYAALAMLFVAAGSGLAVFGLSGIAWALVLGCGLLAASGGRFGLAGIWALMLVLPTQFVPILRTSVFGLTIDPVKVCLAIGLCALALRYARSRRAPMDHAVVALASLLLVAAAVSALLSVVRAESFQWVAHWVLSGAALALYTSLWLRTTGDVETLTWSVVGACALVATYCIAEWVTHSNTLVEYWLRVIEVQGGVFVIARNAAGALPYKPYSAVYRSLGTVGHPVFAAVSLAPAVPLALALAIRRTGPARFCAWMIAAVVGAGVLATGTRGAVVAAFVGAGVVMLYPRVAGLNGRSRVAAVALCAVAFYFGLVFAGFAPGLGSWQRLDSHTFAETESYRHRATTGLAAAGVAAGRPLFGVGEGAFRTMYGSRVGSSDPIASTDDPARFSVDNAFLLMAAEVGIPWVLAFLVLLVVLWRRFRDAMRMAAGGQRARACWLGLMAVVPCLATSYLFADATYVAVAFAPFWMLVGAAMSGDGGVHE